MADFFPFTEQQINDWDEKDTDFLLELDSHGIFPAPQDDPRSFKERLLKEYHYISRITPPPENPPEKIILWGEADSPDRIEVKSADSITRELFEPAWKKTRELYSFAADHVPGYYLFEKVGLLWGGCSLYDDETEMKVFLLRPVFKNKDRFLIYGRDELIAHELCHCARQRLHDTVIEEYFAYQTAGSFLRRYLGNCFIKETDALLFLLPALLLPLAQAVKTFVWAALPVLPFFLLIFAVLGYFFIRNQHSRNVISSARKKLKNIAEKPEAVLFRSTYAELKILNRSFEEYFASLSPMRQSIIKSILKK